MKRAADPLLTASKERARLELRRVLRGLVNLFGYADVKKELFQVKRSVENDRDSASRAKKNAPRVIGDPAKIQHLQGVWLAVETIRRAERPPLAARRAFERLAANGGIIDFAAGSPLHGIGARIKWRAAKVATIEREYKRSEKLRRSDPDLDSVWQGLIADRLGRERANFHPTAAPWAPVAKSSEGETAEK